jgi:hypothetical protein
MPVFATCRQAQPLLARGRTMLDPDSSLLAGVLLRALDLAFIWRVRFA